MFFSFPLPFRDDPVSLDTLASPDHCRGKVRNRETQAGVLLREHVLFSADHACAVGAVNTVYSGSLSSVRRNPGSLKASEISGGESPMGWQEVTLIVRTVRQIEEARRFWHFVCYCCVCALRFAGEGVCPRRVRIVRYCHEGQYSSRSKNPNRVPFSSLGKIRSTPNPEILTQMEPREFSSISAEERRKSLS